MNELYNRLRQQARRIAAGMPNPDFYTDHARDVDLSERLFVEDPVSRRVYRFVAETIGQNRGHGLEHSVKVARDAGALMCIEGSRNGYGEDRLHDRIRMAHCAGLLHDIKRRSRHHAREGAVFVRDLLNPQTYFRPDEVTDIANAIHNHEAFQETIEPSSPEGRLLSDCLYDADKFRWGADNFKYTIWDMLADSDPPIELFIRHYPAGMDALKRIKTTFRTPTGKMYGPRFVDQGISIGEHMLDFLRQEFPACF